MDQARVAKICLGSFPGFGSRSLRKIWAAFSRPEEAWSASAQALKRVGIQESTVERFTAWRKTCVPSRFIEQLEKESIRVLFRDDAEYPQSLQLSTDPPEILFVRGTLKDIPAIAVVGTRRITMYGKSCVDGIVPDLARAGFAIVSGMALGIDGAVHRATLDARGTTVAILGTGVDDAALYPREHVALAQEIIKSGGAVVSEFPPGTQSFKVHFPIRNRLIAAWALATLVIEADLDSGSLITAKLALEENHEVLAIPGPIWADQSRGANSLLKSGAKICTQAADVLEAIAFDQPELIAQARASLPMDPTEQNIIDALAEPKHIDDLTTEIGLDPGSMSGKMALLEIKGLVKPIGGQMWIKTRQKE